MRGAQSPAAEVWRPHEAVFYDGVAARRRAVTLRFREEAVELMEEGRPAASWAYRTIRQEHGPLDVMRFTSTAASDLARLEIASAVLQDELLARCAGLDAPPKTAGAGRIVAWSLAAAVSLVLTVVYGVPLVADRAAPLVPVSLEARLGDAVDERVRAAFRGQTCSGRDGEAALARLTDRLLSRVEMPMPVRVEVLSSRVPNAVALPGGRIYLFEGLIERARSPDEVAGVLAHELGHVANRDAMRRLIQAGGASFLLGLLFGDVTGSGVVILVGESLVNSAHSREAEGRADAFAADAMLALGRSPRPMAELLMRIGGAREEGRGGIPALLDSHPRSRDRLEAMSAREADRAGEPLLTDGEWRALRGICKAG
jgi:Zn-dependent protease with chaperone function